MKRLLDRLVGAGGPKRAPDASQGEEPAPQDEGFFATQFMERPQDILGSSAWQARAMAVGAQSLDAQEGLRLLLAAWGRDAFMASLNDEDHQKLVKQMRFVTVPAGRELIAQDEKGDYACIVLEGLVAVDRIQPTGARARLSEARDGDVLGEMSLLDAGARFACCVTLSRVSLAVLTSAALDELAIEDPRLGMALMSSIARRLSLRMRQLSARLGALLAAG